MNHDENLVEVDVGAAIILVSRRTYDRLLKIIRPASLLNDLSWWQRMARAQALFFEVRYKRPPAD